MNEYLSTKMHEMRLQDSARRQRNADHLEALTVASVPRRKRFLVWITRRFPARQPTSIEPQRRDCPPPCLTSRSMTASAK